MRRHLASVTMVLCHQSRRRLTALAAIKGDRTLAHLSEQFDVHANQISDWKDHLVEFAAEVFERGSSGKASAPAVDIKTLHAKIGELTLENDFLEAALGKAGLPQDLCLSAAWHDDRSGQPGVGVGHH